MASALMRRSALTAALAAVATIASPLAGIAVAAPTLTQSSITPANGSTVADSQPTITAAYSDNLAQSSTLTLTKGATAIACPTSVSNKNIQCTPSSLLTDGTYTVAIHAVDAADPSVTKDDTTTFTVDVPQRTGESPTADSSVASLASANPAGKVSATFDEPIDDTHSTIQVQQVADADGTPHVHTPLTGTTTFNNTDVVIDQNDGDTISFEPTDSTLVNGLYRVSLVVFGVTPGPLGPPNSYNANAKTVDSYLFTVDNTPPAAPSDLSAPPITQANQTAATFSGKANPGNTLTVDLTDGTNHITNTGTSNGGPVTVAPCGTSPCPWTVTLDAHTLSETTSGSWTATAHNDAGDTSAAPRAIVKDTIAPAKPSVVLSLASGSTTLHVSGTDNDASVDHYTITVSDGHSPVLGPVTASRSNGDVTGNGAYSKDIDVAALDDGTLTVTVVQYDEYGNAPASTDYASNTVTKNVGMSLLFGQSAFDFGGGDTVTFPQVLDRPDHAVRPPQTIGIEFTNPITLTRTDTGVAGKDISAPAPYFTDGSGAGNSFNGQASVDPNDDRRLVVTPPAGLADGHYTLHVTVYEANHFCDYSSDPAGTGTPGSCPTYNNVVFEPSSTTPFVFTVDRQPPTTTLSVPNVDADNITAVPMSGTTDPGARVVVTVKSSGGGSTFFANPGGTAADGSGHWAISPSLTSLPDGTLTVSAVATDDAGNAGPAATASPVMQARPSAPRNLGAAAGNGKAILVWSAPTSTGGADRSITGYTLSYTDTSVSGAAAQTATLPGTATSATVSNLANGHTYSFKLTASNVDNSKAFAGGSGPEATTSATPKGTTVLALTGPGKVVYGTKITLLGKLTYFGVGVSGKPVTVTAVYYNGAHGAVFHTTTDQYGNFTLAGIRPAKNVTYVASFAGDGTYTASSASAKVGVRVAIKITHTTWKSRSHLVAVRVTGAVGPNMHGRTVYLYEIVGKKKVRIGHVRLSSKSTWSWSHKFGKGKHRIFARFYGQNGNYGNNSAVRKFTRT